MNNDCHEIFLEIERKAKELERKLDILNENVNSIYDKIHYYNIKRNRDLMNYLIYLSSDYFLFVGVYTLE